MGMLTMMGIYGERLLCTICASFFSISVAGAAPEAQIRETDGSQLGAELRAINLKRKDFEGDMPAVLEQEALALLARYPSPKNRAAVYSALVQMLFNSRTKKPDKIIEYCEKALQLPLAFETECELHLDFGEAIHFQSNFADDNEIRKRVLAQYLKAWDLVYPKKRFLKKQQLPMLAIPPNDVPTNHPAFVKGMDDVRNHQEMWFQNMLLDHSERIIKRISSLYEKPGEEVLRSHISEMAKDAKSAESLLDAVRGLWKKSERGY